MSQPTITFKILAAGFVLAAPFSIGYSQSANQEDCNGVECMSPGFDVGIVYRPPVGTYGITELMIAVEYNDLARVQELLAAGADPDLRNDGGATALLMASAYGNQPIVEQLLYAGADPDIAGGRGDTPLSMAIQHNHVDIAIALLQHRANPDVYHNAGNPGLRKHALVRAAVLGQTDVVRLMIERGVDVSQAGLEALNSALWQQHEEVAAMLIGTGMDLNAATYDGEKYPHMQNGERVLHTAAQRGLVASSRLLIQQGAYVNDRSVRGQSALHFAVRERHPAVVTLLLDAGAVVIGDDVKTALEAGDGDLALQLIARVDLAAMNIAELDTLISRADSLNSVEILDQLYAAREALSDTPPVTTLLFAKADTENCELLQWNFISGKQETVYSGTGKCDQKFHFNRASAELFVVGDGVVKVISLNNPDEAVRVITLPTSMIEKNLAALKQQMKIAFGDATSDWMTAEVVQFGVLTNGEYAFVTHSSGPADGTYGYLYALTGNAWRLVRNESCHRFDACYFGEVLGHSINDRSANMTVWHPDVRLNRRFVSKAEAQTVEYEYLTWNGVVTFDIDGQQSQLRYSKGESGHCTGDCVYTAGLTLDLPGKEAIEISGFSGNNAIVDRYALVWSQPRGHSELIDIGTGKSVFGKLQTAGWLH